MTSKIVSALENNFDKFNYIDKLQSSYIKRLKEKESILEELKKRCSILNGLNTRRVLVGKIRNYQYFFSPSGISKIIDISGTIRDLGWKMNETDLDINEELYEISKIPRVKKFIKKNEAKRKFDKFFKHGKLLRNEPKTTIELRKEIEIKTVMFANSNFYDSPCRTVKVKVKRMTMNLTNKKIQISFLSEDNRMIENIVMNSISDTWKEKLYIEQLYNNIKLLIEKELKSKEKEINNIKLFIQKLKEELPEYFMLEVIEE